MNLIIFQILCLILFIIILILIIVFFIYRKKNNSSQDKIQILIRDPLSSLVKKLNSADPKSNYSLMESISPGYNKRIKIEEDIDYLNKLLNLFIDRSDKVVYLFDYVVENIPYGILLIDNEKRIVKINSSLINLFYLNSEEVLGLETIFVFNNNNFENIISRAFDEFKVQNGKVLFYGDEDIELEIEAQPITIKDPMDETVDKEVYQLILFKNATPEVEFAHLRSKFVANISHEMRTPLTSIKGYLETLVEEDLKNSKVAKKYLNKSLEEVGHLGNLIEDILNLSHIEYKRNTIFLKEHNLVKVIKEYITSLGLLAKRNEIKIKFSYNKDPINFKTDIELFEKLVKNLIENTIFHAGKKVLLKINLNEENERVLLEFSDNGVGINKQDLLYIFQRFYRGKNPFSSKNIGSGLGLAIVKHIVELHNGEISVTSEPNVETKFSIIFPRKSNQEK
jgi:two-component system, OmpR family, phosphate regulon sensor histidine kinase PhoR